MLRWSRLHVDMLAVMLLAHGQACCCLPVMFYYIAISVLACVVVLHVQAAACRLGE